MTSSTKRSRSTVVALGVEVALDVIALGVVVLGLALLLLLLMLLLLLLLLLPGGEEGGDGGGTEADWSRDLMGKSWVSQVSEWAGMLPGSGSSPVGNPFAGLLDRPVGNPLAGVGNPFAGMQVPDPFAAVGVRNPFVAAPAVPGTAPAAAPSSGKR